MQRLEKPFKGYRSEKSIQTPKQKMNNIELFVDTCIKISLVVFLADALNRLFKIAWEYMHYKNYYISENRLWTIIRRALTYNCGTQIFFMLLGCAAFVRFVMTKRLPLPPVIYLAFIPLYWIFCGVNLSHSTLDYASWLREPHGLDYAEGMASNYYLGYLKLTLPQHNESLGITERIKQYEDTHDVKFATNRLVIIIPSNMFVHGKIKSHILEKASKSLETVVKSRAGVDRKFTNDVYKLNIGNESYCVAMEGATPLVSFFDALSFPLTATWQMKEMEREIVLKFYNHLKKLLNEWPETRNRAELIFYDSYTSEGIERDVGEVLMTHVQKLWLQ